MHPTAALLSALAAILLLPANPVCAADAEPIRRAVTEFLDAHGKDLPGPVRYSIGTINAGRLSPDCRKLGAAMDAGARPWGRTHVNVRCTEGATWSLYVPVQIHVTVDYLASARSLRAGQIVEEADIEHRQGDLAELPNGVLTDPQRVLGQASGNAVPAGRPLRTEMFRPPVVVRQGQNVRIVSAGAGFQVASEGRALNSAAAGQLVQVRTASGQVVSGTAQTDGRVSLAQ